MRSHYTSTLRKDFGSCQKLWKESFGSQRLSGSEYHIVRPATEWVRQPNIKYRWHGMNSSWQTAVSKDWRYLIVPVYHTIGWSIIHSGRVRVVFVDLFCSDNSWLCWCKGKPVESIGEYMAIVSTSPRKNYLASVMLAIICIIFIVGLMCGRVTKRVRRELKNRWEKTPISSGQQREQQLHGSLSHRIQLMCILQAAVAVDYIN